MPRHADPRTVLPTLAGLALSGFLLAAPASGAITEPEPPEAAGAEEIDEAAEETVLPREWRLVRAYARRAVNLGEIPGVVTLVVHNDETVFRDAQGHADLEADRLLDPADLVAIASVSKPLTSTVLLLLADQTDFDLDAPVSKYLPEFEGVGLIEGGDLDAPASAHPPELEGDGIIEDGRASRAPTIAELLSHTGGVPGGTIPEVRARYRTRNIAGPLEDAASAAAKLGLESEPGTAFAYGGLGYAIAARAAEVSSGKDFETLCKELLFEPLGMERTTFLPSDEQLENAARMFRREGDELRQQMRPMRIGSTGRLHTPGNGIPMLITGSGELEHRPLISPGGGLYSTADDLAKFAQWHLNAAAGKEGLNPAAPEGLARLRTPMPSAEGPRGRYALGWQLAEHEGDAPATRVHHGGATGTLLWIDFEHNAAGVVLTQLPGSVQFLGRMHALCIAAVTGERPQIERPDRRQRERPQRRR
ncbi:MAG: beta-lactamase family protein [Phycisphaerales bacterium]|nr:beta-lactamase family protein [Phycisphaerales bacterium]